MAEKIKITIKAAEGRRVRHPDTLRLLAADGEEVQASSFWSRRLADGDVVEVLKVTPAPQPAPQSASPESEKAPAAEPESRSKRK